MSFLSLLDESDQYLSEGQEFLLGALLKSGAQSDLYASKWAQTANFDELDASSYRLMPALYTRCGKSEALKKYSGRMKGIFRYYFYRNNRFITRIRQTLATLADHDIDFIVFKGISVFIQYHDSVALRSSGDCDILIRKQDLERTEKVLGDAGWSHRHEDQKWQTNTHSRDYVDETQAGFDLHWYALLESCEDGIDDGFWRRSRELDWKGLKIRVLSPEDEILVAACNGIRDRNNVMVDWLYDADLIFQATPEFDWSLVSAEARARQLGDSLVTALALMDRYVPGFASAEVEQQFQPEIGRGLGRMLAENRNFSFDVPTRQRIESMIRPEKILHSVQDRGVNTDWIARAAASRNTVKFVRFELDDDGWIRRLRFYRDLLAFIPDIFEIHDQTAFDDLALYVSDIGEVFLEPAAGTLRVPDNPRFTDYEAAISIDRSGVSFDGPAARHIRIRTTISNTSQKSWAVYPGQRHTVGLSYHLMDEHGDVLEWDMPRLDLLPRRRHHVTVLLPGNSLEVDFDVTRPAGAGTFHANFDIVHEHVRWFADANCTFPSLEITAS